MLGPECRGRVIQMKEREWAQYSNKERTNLFGRMRTGFIYEDYYIQDVNWEGRVPL